MTSPRELPKTARWRTDRSRWCSGIHVSLPAPHSEQLLWIAPSQDQEVGYALLRTCVCQGFYYELWQSGSSRFIRRVRTEEQATVIEESPRWTAGWPLRSGLPR